MKQSVFLVTGLVVLLARLPDSQQPAPPATGTPGITWVELVTLLAKGEPTETILRNIAERGLAFKPSGEDLAEQAELGVPEAVQQAVRGARRGANPEDYAAIAAQCELELRKALSKDPDNALFHRALGAALMYLNKRKEAIAEMQTAIRLKPDYSQAHAALGDFLTLNDAEGSIAEYRAAVRYHPEDGYYHCQLGNALRTSTKQGSTDEAIAELHEAIRLTPGSAVCNYLLGLALERKGDVAGARTAYREACRLDPTNQLGRENIRGLENRSAADKAKELRQALQKDPRDPYAHSGLGAVLWHSGDIKGATKEFNEAIRLKPDFADAYENLGGMFTEKNEPDAAVTALREAMRLDPRRADTHVDLGNAIFLKGDFDGAISEYREALRLDAGGAWAHYNLGHTFMHTGNFDTAIVELQEALRLEPCSREAKDLLDDASLHAHQIWRNELEGQRKRLLEKQPSGNTSIASTPLAEPTLPKAAHLHVYRLHRLEGGIYSHSFYVDEKKVAQVGNGRRVSMKLSSGVHLVWIEGMILGGPIAILLEARPGEDYFTRIDVETHFWLTLVPPDRGAAEYKRQKPIEEDRKIAKEMIEEEQNDGPPKR